MKFFLYALLFLYNFIEMIINLIVISIKLHMKKRKVKKMKLQYLAVIFVAIIIPISIVMSQYIQNQIDTITLQTLYTESLNNATHDGLKAFQINTINNKYSNISDSKIRDVEASVSTFYNSLGTAMDKYISAEEEVSAFVPAVLFTLYDGYYIHSTYNNIYSTTADGKVQLNDADNNYQTGLRPYIYYSCTYDLGGKKIVVNYTLDNAITVYGDFGSGYVSKSGYLIDYTKVTERNLGSKTLKYDGVQIGPETLTEHLLIVTEGSNVPTPGDYNYIIFNNKKVYQDVDAGGNPNGKYFWYDNYKKTYLQSEETALKDYLNANTGGQFKSIAAFEYYLEAYEFSKWVVEQSGLATIKQNDIAEEYRNDLSFDAGGAYIFNTKQAGNDPMLTKSVFNSHRMAVIRKSIETNLSTVIANYNVQDSSSFQFVLPVIDEENWYSIVNNVSIVSFMQGLPIGQKYYNNYSVITNTKNEEVINEQSVFIVAYSDDGNLEYHQPGCKTLIDKQKNNPSLSMTAYTSLSFVRQTVKVNEANIQYFYPQARNGKTTTGCYNCIVNASADYDIDDIVQGEIKHYQTGSVLYAESNLRALRKAYFTGLARERYYLYRTSKF